MCVGTGRRSTLSHSAGIDSAAEALTSHVWSYNSLEWTSAYGSERNTIVQNRSAILPGKCIGTADEVPQVIIMLMSNAYLTGEAVHVNGGGRFVSHSSSDSVYD
jgi:hypothetical protein